MKTLARKELITCSVLIGLCLSSQTLFAQTLHVNKIEITSGTIVLYYDLRDTVPNRSYTVNVYSSRDNYLNSVTNVSGDFGLEVKPGNEKKVVWNARQELGATFVGKVGVELRARVYVPFIVFDPLDKIKKSRPKEVTWRGATKQTVLNFEIYNKKDEKVGVIPNVPNAGHTSLLIPQGIKSGRGYRLKIVDSKNKDQYAYSERFAIKRKVPLVVYALSAAAVGGLIAWLGDDDPTGAQPIVDPEGPPGSN